MVTLNVNEEKALIRFCHNVWKCALYSSFPVLTHKSFNIQWDILNRCGKIVYIDGTFPMHIERKISIGTDFFNLLLTIQTICKEVDCFDDIAEESIQYEEEMKERYKDYANDLYTIINEGVKYALLFLEPNYMCSNEKSPIIWNILMAAWINKQRSEIASKLRKTLIPKDENWSSML